MNTMNWSIEHVAYCAPLSLPMVNYMFSDLLTTDLWISVYRQIQIARTQVYAMMLKAMEEEGGITTNWFRTSVASLLASRKEDQEALKRRPEDRAKISNETVSNWKELSLLRPPDRGQLDLDSVAAIFICCLSDPLARRQGFLPDEVPPNEPYWYCFAQSGPAAPLAACPIPLPTNLSPETLLVTPWAGANLTDPTWLPIGPLGSARWYGITKQANGRVHWQIPYEDLRIWDPHLRPQDIRLLLDKSISDEVKHVIVQATLAQLALASLTQLTPLPTQVTRPL